MAKSKASKECCEMSGCCACSMGSCAVCTYTLLVVGLLLVVAGTGIFAALPWFNGWTILGAVMAIFGLVMAAGIKKKK